MIKKYKKKPIVVEALQLKWDTWEEMCDFIGVGKLSDRKPEGVMVGSKIGLKILTLEGVMTASEGDWVIKGLQNEFYPCKDSVFQETYEEVK